MSKIFPEDLFDKEMFELSMRQFFFCIGDDPDREGLIDTPARVANAWKEFTSGYHESPGEVLTTFSSDDEDVVYNEMVIVHNIPIVSRCEHHLEPITGIAHIAYVPGEKLVGLSKLPRLAEVYMRRLQVQERLTAQIADALMEHIQPLGAAVVIRAAHGCMSHRGVRIHGATTTTSCLRGVLSEGPARAEFFSLCKMAEDAR